MAKARLAEGKEGMGLGKSTPWGWLVGLTAYWFATSYKWFLLLLTVLPGQVESIVPGGEKSSYWGLVFGVGATWAIIGPALFGHFSDRAGKRKPYIFIGALCTVFALSLQMQAREIWQLTLGYLLIQVSDDVGTGPYSALLPEVVDKQMRGAASGLMTAAMSAGQICGVVTAFFLAQHRHILYLTMMALTLLGAAWTLHAIGPEQKKVAHTDEKKSQRQSWLKVFKSPDFCFVWLSRFLLTLGFYFVIPYAKYFLQDVVQTFRLAGFWLKSADSATAALAFVIASFGGITAVIAGRMADQLGRKRIAYLGGILMAFGLLFLNFSRDLTFLAVVVMAVGIGYGAYQAASWALAADVLPSSVSYGRDMGIWQMSISSVQVLAGSAGFLVTYGNRIQAGLGYTVLFVLAALVVGLSTLVLSKVRANH